MKNFFKIALALAIALSMTACGETQTEDPEISNDPQQNVQQDADSPIQNDESEEPELPEDEPVEPEIPEDSVDSEPEEPVVEPGEPADPENPDKPETTDEDLPKEDISFDPYWAGNDVEMPFPEPPYTYNVDLRDSSVVITSATSVDGYEDALADMKAYCKQLEYFGYNVDVEIDEPEGISADRPAYHFSARNSDGESIEFIYDGRVYMMYADMDFEKQSIISDGSQHESSFDTTWASNDYEKLIPQPPFEGWTGEMKGSNTYELFTSKAKDGDSLNYYDVFQAYLDSLKSFGFSIDGQVYSCRGFDEFGNEFEFKCGDGCAWITIMPVEDLSENSGEEKPTDELEITNKTEDGVTFDLDSDVDVSQIEFLKNILPAGNWTVEKNQNGNYDVDYVLNCGGIPFDSVNDFISKLDEQGFFIFEIIAFDGSYGEYQGEKGEDGILCIVNVQYNGNGSVVSISLMKRAIE